MLVPTRIDSWLPPKDIYSSSEANNLEMFYYIGDEIQLSEATSVQIK